MEVVEVGGVHHALPNVTHVMQETKGEDKISVLKQLVQRHASKKYQTLVFCNTVPSAQAVDYALNDGLGIRAVSLHGDINSKYREENLSSFKKGAEQYLVCTDIAARGLDIPNIHHVILFDFPLNAIDYIHRAGRCGRAGKRGLVTSLVTKRDLVLAHGISRAIDEGLPIDSISSSKRDHRVQYPDAAARPPAAHEPQGREHAPQPKPMVTRKDALISTSAGPGTQGAAFKEGRGARVHTRGKRTVKLNRPVNALGRKLSRKNSVKPPVVKMFPDSTRPLRRAVHDENFRKNKYGGSYVPADKAVAESIKQASRHEGDRKDSRRPDGKLGSAKGGGKAVGSSTKLRSVRSEMKKAAKGGRGGKGPRGRDEEGQKVRSPSGRNSGLGAQNKERVKVEREGGGNKGKSSKYGGRGGRQKLTKVARPW